MVLSKQKLAAAGTGLFALTLGILPFGTVSASPLEAQGTIGENSAVSVQTEYNCNTHTLTAEVTNKLSADITPSVTFDNKKPNTGEMSIPPGKTGFYDYGFSGNGQKAEVKVAVDGHASLEILPTLNCQEPVSFQVTEASDHTVVGYLSNNNSAYPQTVMLRSFTGPEVRVTLQPSESSLVSVPQDAHGLDFSIITLTNGPNFEGSYFIDLTQPVAPPVALPTLKQ